MASYTILEDAMIICFSQRIRLGEPILGPLICEKTLELNDKLVTSTDFKVSTGWLRIPNQVMV